MAGVSVGEYVCVWVSEIWGCFFRENDIKTRPAAAGQLLQAKKHLA